MAAGYVIFYVEAIRDHSLLADYKRTARPTLAAAGGTVAIAYGRHEVLEGAPLAGVVMVEFPSFEAARAWYESDAYRAASLIRAAATVSHSVLVEGIAVPTASPSPAA